MLPLKNPSALETTPPAALPAARLRRFAAGARDVRLAFAVGILSYDFLSVLRSVSPGKAMSQATRSAGHAIKLLKSRSLKKKYDFILLEFQQELWFKKNRPTPRPRPQR
jgi:hypothetical protein